MIGPDCDYCGAELDDVGDDCAVCGASDPYNGGDQGDMEECPECNETLAEDGTCSYCDEGIA